MDMGKPYFLELWGIGNEPMKALSLVGVCRGVITATYSLGIFVCIDCLIRGRSMSSCYFLPESG